MVRILFGWIAAVVAAAATGSLVQSQRAISWIESIDAPIALSDQFGMYAHDLVHFAPTWAAIVAFGFLIAFLVTGWLARRLPRYRSGLFLLAGCSAIVTALLVMNAMLPVTAVAAARDGLGFGLLSLSGAVGGAVYVLVVPQRQKGQN